MIFWPNGRWCIEANVYMLELFDRGLSRRSMGGTLSTYASNISHLIKFCFVRGLEFHNLNDSLFTQFVTDLRKDQYKPSGQRVRDDSTVIAIGKNCLEFLVSVADFRGIPDLVGKEGQINAQEKKDANTRGNRKGRTGKSWHHRSFPHPDSKRRRSPIASSNIQKLKEAVAPASTSLYIRRRRYAMILCLEMTGGRRIEVASIRVDDVFSALKSPTHELKLLTAKQRGAKPEFRMIPMARVDLESLANFIKFSRRSVINNTLGPEHDHGFVFINERNGNPMRANTVTQEVQYLAKFAKLTAAASPHLFRHRFLTKIFVALIEQHQFDTKDDFRRALLSTEQLKRKVMEWSGHKTLEALERYIDLAFDEVIGYRALHQKLTDVKQLESIQSAVSLLALRASQGDLSDSGIELSSISNALSLFIRNGNI